MYKRQVIYIICKRDTDENDSEAIVMPEGDEGESIVVPEGLEGESILEQEGVKGEWIVVV